MLVEPSHVLAVLGLGPETPFEVEPFGGAPGSPVRFSAGGRVVIVRRPYDDTAAMNHAAVSEALARTGYPYVPRLLGFAGDATLEEEVPGASALQVVPLPGAAEAAMRALAALHSLTVVEGLDWGNHPGDLFPGEDVPLHRLGVASGERESAAPHLVAGRDALLASPFGFAHRDATAANVLLGQGQAWLVNFASAGYGPQVWDVAAFLLTSGIEAPGRRALAAAYAAARGTDPTATIDQVDLLGISWGIRELLGLPRRLIESLGDDAAVAALRLAASRIEAGLRAPAGDSPIAGKIRAALWG